MNSIDDIYGIFTIINIILITLGLFAGYSVLVLLRGDVNANKYATLKLWVLEYPGLREDIKKYKDSEGRISYKSFKKIRKEKMEMDKACI